MSRWAPDARSRLQRAALELFAERGFVETTVPDITARAGLTTRTFFRHFGDKREVLFGVEEQLPAVVEQVFAALPAGVSPYRAVVDGLGSVVATRFDGLFDQLRSRRAVIRSEPGLRERELTKHAVLADAIRSGFEQRGVDPLTAVLAGRVAASLFDVALDRWLDQPAPQPDLASRLAETVGAFEALVGDALLPGPSPRHTTGGGS